MTAPTVVHSLALQNVDATIYLPRCLIDAASVALAAAVLLGAVMIPDRF
jgi:hypothetical protein